MYLNNVFCSTLRGGRRSEGGRADSGRTLKEDRQAMIIGTPTHLLKHLTLRYVLWLIRHPITVLARAKLDGKRLFPNKPTIPLIISQRGALL